MSTFYLVRHGLTDWVGKRLAGHAPGIHLNVVGREQAGRIAADLKDRSIRRIYSSPLERATETAEPLAQGLGLEVKIAPEFNEIDFGEWTGCRFEDLVSVPQWEEFNRLRSGTRPPGGELMLEAQCRMVAKLQSLRTEFPEETIAIFSHADVIRAGLLYYLGMPIDFHHRIAIPPGSISRLSLEAWEVKVHSLGGTTRI